MSYSSYRTSSAPSRGRGFSTRGSYRGRGGGDGTNSSWNSTSPRGRGGFTGPSRGRFNWYKESSGFDSRRNYGSGFSGAAAGADRYSSRGRNEESYRRSYRDVSDYSSRDHSHHRSPESARKRMRTEHAYVQASSGRRSHEGSYGGGTDYNSRYSYEDKGYGEDRSRGYRDERRSAGGFRDRSREEYPHRKADPLDSGMPPPSSGPPRHVSSPRGSFRGRIGSRGTRGISRLTLARRADAILARRRSFMDSYSVRKRILTSRAQADSLRRLKIQKLRRMRELAAKKEGKSDKDSGKGAEEVSEEEEEEEEDGELGELEDWDSEAKKEGEENDEEGDKDNEKEKKVKKVKKAATKEEEREEGEEVDEEEEEEEEPEEDEDKGEKEDSPKKSESKNGGGGGAHVSVKQEPDARPASDEVKRTTFHGKPFIRLTCPHCFMRCITFKEYAIHLYSSKHINAMRKQSLRLKQTLARMRMTQRQKQRIVEETESVEGTLSSRTRFCPICKLNYRQFKTKHQLSNYHRAMKKFLMPYCNVCRIAFKSPMLYENHICSLDHIKREARLKENIRYRERFREEGSGEEEDKEVNLDNFMTLDSVGTVDDDDADEDGSEEGKSKGEKDKKEGEEKKKTEANLGSEYVKKVEVLFCELCRIYLPRLDQPERALYLHCRTRLHLTRYVRYRDDRRRESERHHRKEGKDEGEGGKSSDKKKEAGAEKVDSTTEKDDGKVADVEMKREEMDTEDGDVSQEIVGEEESDRTKIEGGEDLDQELEAGIDDKLWADVDKDLGDLLREVEPGNKSSDEDEDSRAEGGRYDRFRYSEKGNVGALAEGDAPDTTKSAVDGEAESEAADEAPKKDGKLSEGKEESDNSAKKQSPSGGPVSSSPVAVTSN